jgi:HEAT repeat protein
MRHPNWLIELDQLHSSYLVLISLLVLGTMIGVLYWIGLVGLVLRLTSLVVSGCIRQGFLLWEQLLSWATWPLFLALIFGLFVIGLLSGGLFPLLRVVCGLSLLVMGAMACLAYMFVDTERYEVERGYKAVHNPLKGQKLAVSLGQYGHLLTVPLLVCATVGMMVGFALLNEGLYQTIGKDWFKADGEDGGPGFIDFLANVIIQLLGIVDVLNLAQSYYFLQTAYVQQIKWPASALLMMFKTFILYVLLRQIFASIRKGNLLAETITDVWSPHEPIRERALTALPQYGELAIEPLLASLGAARTLTREQQDQLPIILMTIGPSTIPALIRHLNDQNEQVRAISVAALGHLHAFGAISLLVALAKDPGESVRRSLVEALGILGAAAPQPASLKTIRRRSLIRRLFRRKPRLASPTLGDPVDLAVTTLESALTDDSVAVRTGAALALGRIGTPAAATVPALIALLKDGDDSVRCQAAESLGKVGGQEELMVPALAALLEVASAPIKVAAARSLARLKKAAAPVISALVPLLQDREESVRTAAADAIVQAGPLDQSAATTLVEGLESPDTVVRAQTAEALGTIGAGTDGAAPALIEAMKDANDRVRGKAAEALGKIGESAAPQAVPSLMHALHDQDNWVSALAAEALGQMGDAADAAIPALVSSLAHHNPQVRGNAAAALGKMGADSVKARVALETAARDVDGSVRSQAIRALGAFGPSTPTSEQNVMDGLQDVDPIVRAAAVEALGRWGQSSAAVLSCLTALLEDANDQVKVEVTRVLPKLAGPTPAVIDVLCRRLLEDDSASVQVHAAIALGQLGSSAVTAGESLLRVIRTGELSVREQAMRAMAMIQPPEVLAAFTAGLTDSSGDIRKIASGGWMKAASIPEEVIPALVVALRDPESQVRANAAHALARLDFLPANAIELLIECSHDASDGVRINAAMALKLAPFSAVGEALERLVEDVNARIRLIAASSLLAAQPEHVKAAAVLSDALCDPAPRIRRAALEIIDALGASGEAFQDDLKKCSIREEESALQTILNLLLKRFANLNRARPVEPSPPKGV